MMINRRIRYNRAERSSVKSEEKRTKNNLIKLHLYSLLGVQTNNITRSSSVVILRRPTVTSHLKITNRSFFHHAPILWNNLPVEMRHTSSSTHSNNMPTSVLPCLALSSSQFHSRLKTYLFHHSYPP